MSTWTGRQNAFARVTACRVQTASSEPQPYRFAENFYRDTPPSAGKMIEWLREMICERGFRVVIIDSLASLRTATDGTKETLNLMRELRRLTHEMDVSMLVVTDSDAPPRGRMASEADLRRSRVLCSAAESVFAIGVHPRGSVPGTRYIVETRSKNAAVVWTEHNAPLAHIVRQPAGMLAFKFDDRFVEGLDDETRELVSHIKTLRDDGKTYTAVAEELEISRSHVVRLYKKWRPVEVSGSQEAVGTEQDVINSEHSAVDSQDDADGEDYDEARYLRDCGLGDPDEDTDDSPLTVAGRLETENIPFGAGMGRRSVYDLPMQTRPLRRAILYRKGGRTQQLCDPLLQGQQRERPVKVRAARLWDLYKASRPGRRIYRAIDWRRGERGKGEKGRSALCGKNRSSSLKI